jgi:hypothetical protein
MSESDGQDFLAAIVELCHSLYDFFSSVRNFDSVSILSYDCVCVFALGLIASIIYVLM